MVCKKRTKKRLTSPPASAAHVIGNLAIHYGKRRRLDALAGADLAAGNLTDASDDITAGREVELASVADDEGVGHGAEAEGSNRGLHCVEVCVCERNERGEREELRIEKKKDLYE